MQVKGPAATADRQVEGMNRPVPLNAGLGHTLHEPQRQMTPAPRARRRVWRSRVQDTTPLATAASAPLRRCSRRENCARRATRNHRRDDSAPATGVMSAFAADRAKALAARDGRSAGGRTRPMPRLERMTLTQRTTFRRRATV